MRKLCASCQQPIMILKSAPQSAEGTAEVKQITTFGCLNMKCDMFAVEVDRTETPLETFTE